MLSNMELYGTEDVPPIPIEIALERQLLLRRHLKAEVAKPLKEQNNHIQNEILKAIKFWGRLAGVEEVGL